MKWKATSGLGVDDEEEEEKEGEWKTVDGISRRQFDRGGVGWADHSDDDDTAEDYQYNLF